ncbi:MAG: DUF350 domain-containing protein [Gammaproteobacteria bacterium]|nr:DUF350 domain-containing protein [Gammaproteobacteria bacterium]
MSGELLLATLINLGTNLIYTLVALALGVSALLFIDRKLLHKVDIEEELKKGNIAVAIFASTILMFVALIVSFGLRG